MAASRSEAVIEQSLRSRRRRGRSPPFRGLRALDSRLRARRDRPFVLLEYAAGLPPEWFAGVAEQVADLARISFCVDTGHVGVKQARDHLARTDPGGDLSALRLGDPRLPELARTVPALARHHQRGAHELLAGRTR